MNWKKIVMFAAAALFAEVVVSFMMGGTALSNDLAAAKERWAWSTVLSFLFATLIFAALAVRQYNRPVLHASLALLLTFVLSLAVGTLLPASLGEQPQVLVALEWLTLAIGLVVGTSIGGYVRSRGTSGGA